MNLTTEQLQAAEKGLVTVEAEGNEYVLLSSETEDKVKHLISYDDCDLSHDELRTLLAQSAEGSHWHEPDMEDYDRNEGRDRGRI